MTSQWEEEPNRRLWRDRDTGRICLIIRHPDMLHLCGYVQVSEEEYEAHDYRELHGDLDIDVHGGLNFQGEHHDSEGGKWVGFDCAHAWDIIPGFSDRFEMDQTYRTFNYVEQECAKLARQIEDIVQRGRDAP